MKVVTNSNFQQEVLDSKRLVLVDVWAPWCGPCRAMMPIFEELADEAKEKYDFVKIDASEQMDLVQQLNVSSLPTFLVFKDGQIVDSNVGMTSKANLLGLLEKI